MSRSVHHPTARVTVLCILAFFAGRFLQLPRLPEARGRGPTVQTAERRDRKLLLDSTGTEGATMRSERLKLQPPQQGLGGRSYGSFEEAMDASGMLADRPPVPAGESGHKFYTVQPVQLLSWYPRAFLFPKFMDKQRCQEVIHLAEGHMEPSGLALRDGDSVEDSKDVRTSQGTFLARDAGPVMAWIEDKIAVLTGIPASHGEAFNVLHYERGEHYDSHYDAFDEAAYGKQESHRIATVVIYLTDVEEGGETSFQMEGRNGTSRVVDTKTCSAGIKYKPRAGDALLFWSVNPDNTPDMHSLHGACPVVKGSKWTAAKWIREKVQGQGAQGW